MPNDYINQIQVGTTTYDIQDNIARQNIESLSTSLSTMAFQPDAPFDNKPYGRQNGNWIEIQSTTTTYTLPTATSTELGGIKIGEGLSIDNSGVVSVSTESGGDGYTHIISSIDLEEGVSILPENTIYFYYEVEE